MAKKIFIPLGFEIGSAVAAISERGLKSRDKIIFIVSPKKTERSEKAKDDIISFLNMIKMRGVKVKVKFLEIDEHNPSTSLKILINEMLSSKDEIYIDIAGGLRIHGILLILASIFLSYKIKDICVTAESTGSRIHLEIPKINIKLSKVSRKILQILLQKKSLTLESFTYYLNKSKSTLSKQLNALEKMGLIKKICKKPAKYEITSIGKILLCL